MRNGLNDHDVKQIRQARVLETWDLFLPSYTTQLSSISMVSVPTQIESPKERRQDETRIFLRRNDRS